MTGKEKTVTGPVFVKVSKALDDAFRESNSPFIIVTVDNTYSIFRIVNYCQYGDCCIELDGSHWTHRLGFCSTKHYKNHMDEMKLW